MNILVRPSYSRSIKKYSSQEISEINAAIALLPEALGKPHVHAGLGIRKLRAALFELWTNLQIRVLFLRDAGDLILVFAGNHDQVRVWLKANS